MVNNLKEPRTSRQSDSIVLPIQEGRFSDKSRGESPNRLDLSFNFVYLVITKMKRFLSLTLPAYGYERNIHIFLSFFRFIGFSLAVALITALPKLPTPDWQTLLIVILVGVYTALKVVFHFRLWHRDLWVYSILGGDLVLCLAVVLATGGADSPFLLYSLLPTITAALFFSQRITLIIASLTALNLILAHTILSRVSANFRFILQGDGLYLIIVLLYSLFCFLIALIAYQTNLNVYRRIQTVAILEERKRLRQEIHDGIAQVLGYLNMKLTAVRQLVPPSDGKLLAELEEIRQVTSASYQDIREAIDSLTTEIEPVSLLEALSRYVEQISKSSELQIQLVAPQKPPVLPPHVSLQLLRIVQEALNNVRKHAAATKVWVKMETTPRGVALVVKDNGRGFSLPAPRGIGFKIMEERAESINAVLSVLSSPGKGTEITVKVPRG